MTHAEERRPNHANCIRHWALVPVNWSFLLFFSVPFVPPW